MSPGVAVTDRLHAAPLTERRTRSWIRKHTLCKWLFFGYLGVMSTVQEIEAAIPRLSRAELEEFEAWFQEYLEERLELTDDVKAKLDESRREIAAGSYTTRQPK